MTTFSVNKRRNSSSIRKHIVHSSAPIRVCDNGGWTDTWFAKHGKVFNLAVHPCVEVEIEIGGKVSPNKFPAKVTLLENGAPLGNSSDALPDHRPWVEAARRHLHISEEVSMQTRVYSPIPLGAGTGTSAALSVALIGALMGAQGHRVVPLEVARAAHAIETDQLGRECGIQDQLCSALGGINFIAMHQYPRAKVFRLCPSAPFLWELERRLVLVYLGNGHNSSEIHKSVIQRLSRNRSASRMLDDLRHNAAASRQAVLAEDLTALGQAMIRNTECQAQLHPDLVSDRARQAINIAKSLGAQGWKVNGAGGDGGSLTILLGPSLELKHKFSETLFIERPDFTVTDLVLNVHGLRVW